MNEMESHCPLSFCRSPYHTCIEQCNHPRKYEWVAPLHFEISGLCKDYVCENRIQNGWTFYLQCIKTVYFTEDKLNDEQLMIFLYYLGIHGPFTSWTRADKIGTILEKYRIFMCDWFIERENTFPDTVTPDPVPDTVHPDPMPVTVTPVPDTTDHYDEMLDEMLLENDPPVYMSRDQLLYHSTRRALAEAPVYMSRNQLLYYSTSRALAEISIDLSLAEDSAFGRALDGRSLEDRSLEDRPLDDDEDDMPSLISEGEHERREHVRQQIPMWPTAIEPREGVPSIYEEYQQSQRQRRENLGEPIYGRSMPFYQRNQETKYNIQVQVHKTDTTDFIKDENAYVECPICYESECFVTLSCQHSFCECILTHVLNKPLNTCCTCPCCRQTITEMTVHSPKFYKIIRATTGKHSNLVFE